jgi:hypothetical protein
MRNMPTKTRCRPDPYFPELEPVTNLLRTPPLSNEDRLIHIRALGDRVEAYIRFICSVGELRGSSAEEKDRAVVAFYERLRALEQELGRIHKGLRHR